MFFFVFKNILHFFLFLNDFKICLQFNHYISFFQIINQNTIFLYYFLYANGHFVHHQKPLLILQKMKNKCLWTFCPPPKIKFI
ncbi:MAG: hypothetical protein EAZ85_03145 [Bacteroidetes bacterium]|nr:MAG: hypothetical protein EAZ85_03145 [Bacteroidota bacterium]TAG85968.1 MAG: hypothetical protein EAZ20_13785 [Bacteroidota bacterium]